MTKVRPRPEFPPPEPLPNQVPAREGCAQTAKGFWQVLRIVNRTLLPRLLSFGGPDGGLDLEVADRCVLVAPRHGTGYLLTEQLKQDAPRAHAILFRGRPALSKEGETLGAHRQVLLKHTVATLIDLAGRTVLTHRVHALPTARAKAPVTFSVPELLAEASSQLCPAVPGPVQAFFDRIGASAAEAWMFGEAAWPIVVPEALDDLERVGGMMAWARLVSTWRQRTEGALPGPSLLVLTPHPAGRDVWSAAVDGRRQALVRVDGAKLGTVFATWKRAMEATVRGS